jgi:hypothetical protein
VAIRISATHLEDHELIEALRERARIEGITTSEALRQAITVRLEQKVRPAKRKEKSWKS